MEPLDPDLPARRHAQPLSDRLASLRLAPADLVAPAALGGAAALALSSRGDALLLALLLGAAAWRVAAGVALGLAAVAVAVRFGGTDLGDVASAQAVLGPAALIGSTAAAASSWCAALATVLAGTVPRAPSERGWRALVVAGAWAAPFGAAPATFGFGPGPGGDVWIRVVAAVAATGAVVALGRAVPGRPRLLAATALGAGVAAVALAVVGT